VLREDLESTATYLLEQSNKAYVTSSTVTSLLKENRSQNTRIDKLRKKVRELKQGYRHYVPIHSDYLDCAVANWINAR
jgi:hypothetical protein